MGVNVMSRNSGVFCVNARLVAIAAMTLLASFNCGATICPAKGAPAWYESGRAEGNAITVFPTFADAENSEDVVWIDELRVRVTKAGMDKFHARIGRVDNLKRLSIVWDSESVMPDVDVSFLSNMTNLTVLLIGARARLRNFGAIRELPLEDLQLNAVRGVDDEQCLAGMSSLTSFTAPRTFAAVNLLPAGITNLSYRLNAVNVTNAFAQLSTLRRLEVYASKGIGSDDIDALGRCISNCKKLEELNLCGDWAGLRQSGFLSGLMLKNLSLERTSISSFVAVALPNLEYFRLKRSPVRSLGDLGRWPKLRTLELLNMDIRWNSPSDAKSRWPTLRSLRWSGEASDDEQKLIFENEENEGEKTSDMLW